MAPIQAAKTWRCEICSRATPPVLGNLLKGAARHCCRTCHRTVCGTCSSVPLRDDVPCKEERACKDCSGVKTRHGDGSREKYIFLVRHAQSTWNGKVDLVKTVRYSPLEDINMKDVVSSAAQLMAEMWHRDHPISPEGVSQIEEMKKRIDQQLELEDDGLQNEGPELMSSSIASSGSGQSSGSSRRGERPDAEARREHQFYSNFLRVRQQIYCSPLLRALQTAHLLFPKTEHWGSIKLLKDARERFNCSIERDCLGQAIGPNIVTRAMQICQDMEGLDKRVDTSNCEEKWWSESPETEQEVDARLCSLWTQLLEEDREGSCVLVTHSNLIKALLMRFGVVDESFIFTGSHRSTREDEPEERLPAGTPRFQEDDSEEEPNPISSWQVVRDGPSALRQLKVERLQNCGVLGVRCVSSRPPPTPVEDGEYTVVAPHHWVAKDALLMFGSVLVN